MKGNRLSRDGTCFHSKKDGLNLARADNKDTNDRTESLGVIDRHLRDFGKNVVNGLLMVDNKPIVNLFDNRFIVKVLIVPLSSPSLIFTY